MYRIKDIQNSLMHLVGWRDAYNPDDKLSESLLETESGLTFQEAHPLMTLDNIKSTMPEDFIMKYTPFVQGSLYDAGTIVRQNNKTYKCKVTNAGNPLTDGYYWDVYSILNDYLPELVKTGITKMVHSFIEYKGLKGQTKNLLEHRTLFNGSGRLKAIIPGQDMIVGFEIKMNGSAGVTTKIEKVGIQAIGGNFYRPKIYLFHESVIDPLASFDISTNPNGSFEWTQVIDVYLRYFSNYGNSGGSFYLVYDQSKMPADMQAININLDWSKEPCGSCGTYSENAKEVGKYLQISPFKTVKPADWDDAPYLWDLSDNIYTTTVNYGLNMEITVGCDLTDFIITQKSIFQSALQKQVAANALREMAFNPSARVNRNQSNVQHHEILYEIDGKPDAERPSGLNYELKRAMEAVHLDTVGMDKICLNCKNGGIKIKTMG